VGNKGIRECTLHHPSLLFPCRKVQLHERVSQKVISVLLQLDESPSLIFYLLLRPDLLVWFRSVEGHVIFSAPALPDENCMPGELAVNFKAHDTGKFFWDCDGTEITAPMRLRYTYPISLSLLFISLSSLSIFHRGLRRDSCCCRHQDVRSRRSWDRGPHCTHWGRAVEALGAEPR
jgi:hypothetical protein